MNRQHFIAYSFITAFFLFAACIIPTAYAQNTPQANVDRTVISEGDSLTLTISVDGSSDGAPDYSALKKDFDVLGSNQSTQHSLINGHLSSRTEWQTTLMPKRSGQLTIPPIAVGSAATQAITIQVNAAGRNNTNDGSEPIFLETQIDRNAVYVQQQLLFTVRVFVAVQLEDMQLTKPEFDNASVKQLSETTFRRDVNGTPYAVHELTYAIFPQQPGELTIPELVFSAVEVTGTRSLFDFPGQGRTLRRMSKQLSVHVKPIPKTFSGSVWLPARNLTLTESWGRDAQHLKTGESITRSIAIRASGLLAAQLPALDAPTLDGAKIYADQPALDDQQDSGGVHGKRVENMALIPTKAGSLHLPETKIVWWDIDSDSEKIATLNAETLSISPGAATGNAISPPTMPEQEQRSTATPIPDTETLPQTPSASMQIRLWQITCAGLLLLWIATLYLYWRARRVPKLNTEKSSERNYGTETNEDAAWQSLTTACRSNEPTAARQALLQWARIFFSRSDLHSVDQLQKICADAALTRELQQLDNRLFGMLPDSGEWNGETLLQVAKKLRKQTFAKTRTEAQLPPLYPAN